MSLYVVEVLASRVPVTDRKLHSQEGNLSPTSNDDSRVPMCSAINISLIVFRLSYLNVSKIWSAHLIESCQVVARGNQKRLIDARMIQIVRHRSNQRSHNLQVG